MSNIIVIGFSPRNIVACLLKKVLQRGGHGHPRTPLATPLVTELISYEGNSLKNELSNELNRSEFLSGIKCSQMMRDTLDHSKEILKTLLSRLLIFSFLTV